MKDIPSLEITHFKRMCNLCVFNLITECQDSITYAVSVRYD